MYSLITGAPIGLGLLKIYSVIIRVPGEESSSARGEQHQCQPTQNNDMEWMPRGCLPVS